jgi:hypothetical protein
MAEFYRNGPGLINQNGYATFGGSTSNTNAILTLGASSSTVAQLNFTSGSMFLLLIRGICGGMGQIFFSMMVLRL